MVRGSMDMAWMQVNLFQMNSLVGRWLSDPPDLLVIPTLNTSMFSVRDQ